jgi:arsenite methyltransferase
MFGIHINQWIDIQGGLYMATPETIRQQVSDAYHAAVTHPQRTDLVAQTGGSTFASYTSDDLHAVPTDVVASSFGCGNPLAFSAISPGSVVLDLGCGAGLDLLLAAARVGPEGQVIGVDMTPAMLDKARATIAKSDYTNIELHQGVIEALPIADQSVDWVISNCVVNLSPEKERVFREIMRVLKPGGRFAISDIVVDHLPWWVRKSAPLYAACVGGAISESAYIQGLERAGMQVIVQERLVYEASQIVAVLSDILPPKLAQATCCGRSVTQSFLRWLVDRIAPQVWSAKFVGEKPNGT